MIDIDYKELWKATVRDVAVAGERIRELTAERDSLSAQLRAAGEQLEAARDQHGYLVSAAAFDEVCEERDALAKKLSVSPAVRELADNICRNISKAQQHVFCNSEIEPDGDMLDLLNHMETLAQQIAFDSGDSVAAPVPPSQEARDAEEMIVGHAQDGIFIYTHCHEWPGNYDRVEGPFDNYDAAKERIAAILADKEKGK